MDQSPSSSASEATNHPYNSISCETSRPQETAELPFKNTPPSKNPCIAQISSESNSSTEALTKDPAKNTAVAAGITEYENSPEQQISSQSLQRNVRVILLDEKIWKEFYRVGNEMIVTKPGRRLFPAVMVSLRGLDLTTLYDVTFKVTLADPYCYKFKRMKWQVVGMSEVNQNESRQIYLHSNSPNTGEFWMKKPVSFKSVKISHSQASTSARVLVHTMHKYIVEIVVTPQPGSRDPKVIVVPLKETTFVAVSAYQNFHLTQLKIDNNPFAKGFRDSLKPLAVHPYMTASACMQHLPYNSGELDRQTSPLTPMVHPVQIFQCGTQILYPGSQMLQPWGQILQRGARVFPPGDHTVQPTTQAVHPRAQTLGPHVAWTPVANMVDRSTPFNPLPVPGTPMPPRPLTPIQDFLALPPMDFNMPRRRVAAWGSNSSTVQQE